MEAKKKITPLRDFWKGKGKTALLIVGALLGVLLLVIGGNTETSTDATSESYMSAAELAEYRTALESEIAKMCDAVAAAVHKSPCPRQPSPPPLRGSAWSAAGATALP